MIIHVLARGEPDGDVRVSYFKTADDAQKQITYEEENYNQFNHTLEVLDTDSDFFDEPEED